jgi:hypothetical protein
MSKSIIVNGDRSKQISTAMERAATRKKEKKKNKRRPTGAAEKHFLNQGPDDAHVASNQRKDLCDTESQRCSHLYIQPQYRRPQVAKGPVGLNRVGE